MPNGKMIYALVGCCLFIILHIPQFYGSPCNCDCAGVMETEDSGHGDMEAALPKHVSDKLLARLNFPFISSLENHFGKISGYGDRAAALPKEVSDKLLQWRKVPLIPSLDNHFRKISGYGDRAAALPKQVSDKLLQWRKVPLNTSLENYFREIRGYGDMAAALPKQVSDKLLQWRKVTLNPSLENHFREISGYGDMAAALPKDVSDKLLAWLKVHLIPSVENLFGKRMSDAISSPGFNDNVNDYCDFVLGQAVAVIPQLKAAMLIPGARPQLLNFMKVMVKKAVVLLLFASDEQNKEANSFVDMYVSDTVERKRKRNGNWQRKALSVM